MNNLPRLLLFSARILTVQNRVLGFESRAVEFRKPGMPEIQRFHCVAGMSGPVGFNEILRDGNGGGTLAARRGFDMEKFGHE